MGPLVGVAWECNAGQGSFKGMVDGGGLGVPWGKVV